MTFIDPPWRLDPFQNIVNANFGGLGPWLIMYLWSDAPGIFTVTASTFNAGRRFLPSTITLMGPANTSFQSFPTAPSNQRLSDIVTPYMRSSLVSWISPIRDFGAGLTKEIPIVGEWFDAYAVFNLGLLKAISPSATKFTFQIDQPPFIEPNISHGAVMATVKMGFNNPTYVAVFDRAVVGYGFPILSFQRREGPGMLVTEGPSPGFPPNEPTAFYLTDYFWSAFFPTLPPPGTIITGGPPTYWGDDPNQSFFGYINPFFSVDPWSDGSVGFPGQSVPLQTNFYAGLPFFNDIAAPVYAVSGGQFVGPGKVEVNMTTGQFLIGPRELR